jgi:hypothetical protein
LRGNLNDGAWPVGNAPDFGQDAIHQIRRLEEEDLVADDPTIGGLVAIDGRF